MAKRLLAWLFAVLALVGIVVGLGYYKYLQFAAFAGMSWPEPSETIQAVEVEAGVFTATSRAIGTVVALRTVEIRTETAGKVVEVGFASGAAVGEGQPLLKLDDRAERAQRAEAEASLRLAQSTFARRDRLREGQSISVQDVDDAREQVAMAQARIEQLDVVIDRKTIEAPFAGRVGLSDWQPGAYLDAGATVTTLIGVGPDAYVDFTVPQEAAAQLAVGDTVTLTGAQAPGGSAKARIVAEDARMSGDERAVRFRALAPGLGETLRPGGFVDVAFEVAPPTPVMTIPLTAVRRGPAGDHVFAIVEEPVAPPPAAPEASAAAAPEASPSAAAAPAAGGETTLRARQRFVKLGPPMGESIVVLEGLALGERIAGAGSFKLREGLKVQVAPPAGGAEPAPAAAPAS